MSKKKYILAAAAVALAPGCASSIQSTHYKEDSKDIGRGTSYYLPKRLVRIVVERTPAKIDRTALAAALQKANTERDKANLVVTEKTVLLDVAKRDLEAAKKVEPALPAETIAAKQKSFDDAEVAFKIATLIAAQRIAEVLEATKALNEIPQSEGNNKDGFEETVAISLSGYLPDEKARLVADLHHHWSRNDDWLLEVTPTGLLTSADSNPDGKADEIIVEIAKVALAVVNPAGVSSFARDFQTRTLSINPRSKRLDESSRCPQVRRYRYEFEFDPTDGGAMAKINEHLASQCSAYRVEFSALPDLSGFPVAKDARSSPISDGLAYRRERVFSLKLLRFKDKPDEVNLETPTSDYLPNRFVSVTVPNGAPVEVLPFEPSAFTKQTMAARFNNGMLVRTDFEKPSEGLSVALMPAAAISGAFTLAGELLTARFNNLSKETQIVEGEAKAIEALKKLLEAQEALEEARKGAESGE